MSTATEQTAGAIGPEVLTAQEAAKMLRLNIKTVYAMVEKKQLPGARWFRGTIRIHRPTLLAWMADGVPSARAVNDEGRARARRRE